MSAEQTETFIARRLRLKAERDAATRAEQGTPWTTRDTGGEDVPADSVRAQRWIDAKVNAQLNTLAALEPGERNHTLNAIAFSMGHYVPKWLDGNDVARLMYEAARACGLDHDESIATINSGLTSGMRDPKDPPVNEPAGASETSEPFAETPLNVDTNTGEITETPGERIRRLLPILDWNELWSRVEVEEWIVEPLLPARRLIALYSAPKMGKSLLLLELAVGIALGRSVLGADVDRPRKVLYIDFENDPKADVQTRLEAMGYGPEHLSNLCYLSYPTLAALDSERGGKELMAAVNEYGCEVVIIDTVSRSIAGEENENDTWLNFYRHTGLLMKQAGVALIRLDHSGKDETKGQRGGSAKSGDVDAVWRLSKVSDDVFRLDCEAARMPIVEKVLVLHRDTEPLRHRVEGGGSSAAARIKIEAAVQALDDLRLANDTGRDKAGQALRAAGQTVGTWALSKAVAERKRRLENLSKNGVDRSD